MDVDTGVVTGVIGLGTGVLALIRTQFQNARRDLVDCRKTTEKQATEIEALKSGTTVLTHGLADLSRKHSQLEQDCAERDLKAEAQRESDGRRLESLRSELAEIRRSIA